MQMLWIVTYILFFSLPAQAEFIMDLDHKDLKSKLGIITLDELSIGESGVLKNGAACISKRGLILLQTNAQLNTDPGDYAPSFVVTKHPAGKYSLKLRPGTTGYGKNERPKKLSVAMREIFHSLLTSGDCDMMMRVFGNHEGQWAPIEAIEGHKKGSEIMKLIEAK